jgi:hypothetical protein
MMTSKLDLLANTYAKGYIGNVKYMFSKDDWELFKAAQKALFKELHIKAINRATNSAHEERLFNDYVDEL